MSGIVSTIVTADTLGDGGRYARGYVGRGADCTAIGEDGVVGRAGGGKYARGYVGRAGCTTGGDDVAGGRAGGGKYVRGYVGRAGCTTGGEVEI